MRRGSGIVVVVAVAAAVVIAAAADGDVGVDSVSTTRVAVVAALLITETGRAAT